jgi:hypothetical protein
MMQQFTPTSSGMITHSMVNPTDEIPVGPQVFPYGTPQLSQSQVNPYMATNYSNTMTTTSTTIPTTTSVQYVETPVQEVYQTTPVVQTSSVVQTTPVVQTQYQKVIRYKPVTKTVYMPKVVTSYVQAPANSVLPGSVVPGSVLPGAVAPGSVVAGSVMPTVVPQPVMPLSPVVSNQHFVSNYPVV